MEKDYTEVYYYLKLTEFYLSGDLKEIKSISKKAEDTDILHNIPHRFSISGLYPQLEMKAGLNFENPESAIFRLTLPIASALFATLDFLGYLIGDNDDATKTYINFPEFFKYARKLNFNISDEEVDIINSVFRQGVAHTYLPKLNSGISYYSGNPNDRLFLKEMGNILVLNLRYLETIVITVLRSVINNSDLSNKVANRYDSLQSKYKVVNSDKIKLLLSSLT